MRWKSLLVVFTMLLVMFSFSTLAVSTITVTPIDNEITPLEQASFSLRITNNEDEVQRYSIYSLQSGQGWNVDPYPLRDKIIELGPRQSHTTTMIAHPLEKGKFSPGIYQVQVTIQSDLGETYTKSLKIYLSPEKPVDYLPAIIANLDMNEKINPKEPVSIKLFLENRNPLNLTDLEIGIQSDIPEFVKEIFVDLPPLEKKTVEFSIVPNKYQQPKDYTLFFVFKRDGETIKIIEKYIEIVSLLPDFTVESITENIFLKSFKTLTIRNEGNVLNTQMVKYPISFLSSLITTSTTSEAKTITEDGKRFLAWELTLAPDESTALNLVTNYRLLIYILATLLIFGGFYLYVQSPLSLKKNAVTTQSGDSGALSEIKITLELSNHSKKVMKDVEVIDLIPSIANIEKGLELGTLKPTEIKHTKLGTKIKWSLAEIDPHEHRLITYKMKAKLNILGTFSLPRATVEFKKKKRKKKAYSNIFRISS